MDRKTTQSLNLRSDLKGSNLIRIQNVINPTLKLKQ